VRRAAPAGRRYPRTARGAAVTWRSYRGRARRLGVRRPSRVRLVARYLTLVQLDELRSLLQ